MSEWKWSEQRWPPPFPLPAHESSVSVKETLIEEKHTRNVLDIIFFHGLSEKAPEMEV